MADMQVDVSRPGPGDVAGPGPGGQRGGIAGPRAVPRGGPGGGPARLLCYPAATLYYIYGTTPGIASAQRCPAARVERLVERRGRNPSAACAVSAIPRVIGAASALSARRRGYGKEKVYGSIP